MMKDWLIKKLGGYTLTEVYQLKSDYEVKVIGLEYLNSTQKARILDFIMRESFGKQKFWKRRQGLITHLQNTIKTEMEAYFERVVDPEAGR